jgi:hypothetical protein
METGNFTFKLNANLITPFDGNVTKLNPVINYSKTNIEIIMQIMEKHLLLRSLKFNKIITIYVLLYISLHWRMK